MFTKTLVAAVAALPFLTQSALAAECARTHTIQAGEICYGISRALSVPTYQLSVVNNGIINSDCSNLVAGQNLCLGYVGEDCSDTYVVEANDSCEDIYDNFSINATTFMLNNPNIDADCGNLFIGQVLCVAGGAAVSPAPEDYTLPSYVAPPNAEPATPAPETPAAPPAFAPPTDTPAAPVPTVAPSAPTVAPSAPTDAPTAPAAAAPTPSAPSTDDSDDSDAGYIVDDSDDSLPYCDELEL